MTVDPSAQRKGNTLMTYVDATVGDVTIRIQLNVDGAPTTAAAFADALPFSGRAVHAQTSGQMFRMLEDVPIDNVSEVEDVVHYQWPGVVIYHPGVREIAFAYGNARFSGPTAASSLTKLGTLDGDLTELIAVVTEIRHTGAVPLSFSLSDDQTTPLRPIEHQGRKVVIDYDGLSLSGTLLEQGSPVTTAALIGKLPVILKSITSTWRGQHSTLELSTGCVGLDMTEREASSTHLVTPGTIYYSFAHDELSFVYGRSSNTLRDGIREVLTPVIALDGDWSAVQERALAQLTEGAKPISIELA
ncbi:DUF3830 family protein [Glaciibacter superstes]|uniref:DUF3830 family protein n=1 Tax=Glaciibacter superstes TaxID=501023 RepID=UPI0003B5E92B|nr:DUF3830 family protein [Glaciibacter superstes]